MMTLREIEAATAQLSCAEKLQLMESLWAGDDWSSPPWHGEALAEIERRFNEGREPLLDWEDAKKELRETEM